MKNNLPKQYQQGWTEFYKLRFKLNPDVLIPRSETELLVDAVLQTLKEHPEYAVLDLGTGSGNIAISIAKNAPAAKIIATDISSKALKIAKQNAKFHQVEDQVIFLENNLIEDILPKIHNTNPFPQIIVTNLPYIPSQRIDYLDSSVKDFEPLIALDGGEDGFELYRKLFSQIKAKKLKPKLLFGEIDYTHRDLAYNEAYKFFPNAQIEVKKDLAKLQRILTINFK